MIIKKGEGRGGGAAGRGHSFKKLAAYLLSPKDEGDRALWSDVLNLGTDNPHMAARVMAATAMNAEAIKARAGVSKAGRKSQSGAVYHVVMSWAEDETPTPEHQREAARSMLAAVGLESAQALIVAHADNGKPHIHIVANLIDPNTGKQYSLSNDQRHMSDWALAYERENGGVRVQQRAENAERRALGEKTKDTASLSRPEYERMQASARQSWAQRRAARNEAFTRQGQARTDQRDQHKAEWAAAKAEAASHRRAHDALFRAALKAAKDADKLANKPQWRALFQRHRVEGLTAAGMVDHAQARLNGQRQITENARRLLRLSERFERSFIARKVLKPLGLDVSADRQRAGLVDAQRREAEARQAVAQATMARTALTAAQEAERKALAASLSEATLAKVKAAVTAVNPVDFGAMIQRQDEERRRLIEAQNAERAALGMKPYQPRRKEADTMESQITKNADKARDAFKAAAPSAVEPSTRAPLRPQGAASVPAPSGQSNSLSPGAVSGVDAMRAEMEARAIRAEAKAEAKAKSPEGQQAAKDAFEKARQKRKDGPSL
jgi:hypothetical protein